MRTLREARESRGWELRELTAVTGISFGHLAKAERGEVVLSPEYRIRLIRAFGLSLAEAREIAEFAIEVPA